MEFRGEKRGRQRLGVLRGRPILYKKEWVRSFKEKVKRNTEAGRERQSSGVSRKR